GRRQKIRFHATAEIQRGAEKRCLAARCRVTFRRARRPFPWMQLGLGKKTRNAFASSNMSKSSRSISVRAGRLEFVKINAAKFDLRDTYHLILTLSWPRFAAMVLAVYILINLVFASLYS